MSNKESRRIVPVSAIAIAAFAVLVVFEVLVIGGVLELKASTVARIAPWAYEPFLKLVGEHPDSGVRKAAAPGEAERPVGESSGIASVAGFNPDAISLGLEQDGNDSEIGSPEAADQPEIIPVKAPTNTPAPDPKEVVPVG